MKNEFGATPDRHNSSMTIAELNQGGLTLPDRDYYLKTDPKTTEQRQEYRNHVARMLALAGEADADAKRDADTVLRIETKLAEASLDRTSQRDPANLDHKMKVAEFNALAPNIYLTDYLKAVKAPAFDSLNVTVPEFFRSANGLVESVPLEDWKTYFRWRVVHGAGQMLSDDFVNELFRFNGQYLRGTKKLPDRWKRCVNSVDQSLGEASGQMFVETYFGASGREKVHVIVNNIIEQLSLSIGSSDWMSEQT